MTPQQTCFRLAGNTTVIYVDPLRSPLWRLRALPTHSRQPASFALQPIAPNLWRLTLPAIFLPMAIYKRIGWCRALNNWAITKFVSRAIRGLGIANFVVWVYQITFEGAPLLRRSDLIVYDCIDDWAGGATSPGERKFFARLDQSLCATADVVFFGSNALARARRPLARTSALVPQGVDLEHFLREGRDKLSAPADLASLARPRIGLVGVLNKERIDIALLCEMARRHPEWSLALIGPVWPGLDTELLAKFSNIHLLGNKTKEQLGDYMAALDVCILPYLINDFTRAIFPLKLFEYLASGNPFVSTAIPACSEYPELIHVAASHEAFMVAVERSLLETDSVARERRVAAARANDWAVRVASKVSVVSQALASRQSR